MMLADIILIVLVFLAVLAASIVDIRKREVPDWISYMLIASALLMRLLYAWQFSSWSYFLYGIIGLLAMALVGMVLFYAKQWGGGDAKLLIGIGAAWGTAPYFVDVPGPFLLYFLLSLAVMGALYGLAYSLALIIMHFHAWKNSYCRLIASKKIRKFIYIFGIAAIILGIVEIAFISNFQFKISLLTLLPFIFIYPYFYVALKAVENIAMYKTIHVSKLTEGDWIADPVIKKKFNIPKWGIEQKQIDLLRKSKLQNIRVKEGIPFVPSFFFATVLVLNIDAIRMLLF